MKKKMVVGFMFNYNETEVLLIEKKKPQWQLGKLNGIGGKVEKGETYLQAMIREFKEETGIDYPIWKSVTLMYSDDWEVQVFTAKSDSVFDFKTMEDEKVCLIPVEDLDQYEHISNLQWLIPMCLDAKHIDYQFTNYKNP